MLFVFPHDVHATKFTLFSSWLWCFNLIGLCCWTFYTFIVEFFIIILVDSEAIFSLYCSRMFQKTCVFSSLWQKHTWFPFNFNWSWLRYTYIRDHSLKDSSIAFAGKLGISFPLLFLFNQICWTFTHRQELFLLDNEIAFNEAIIEEREHGLREIEEQIGQANEIFKDLAVLVHEQGVVIGKMTNTK